MKTTKRKWTFSTTGLIYFKLFFFKNIKSGMSSTSLDKSCKSFEESISKQLQDKSINITNIVNDLQREMSNAVQQLKLLQGFL